MHLPLAIVPSVSGLLRVRHGAATLDDVAFQRDVLFPKVVEPLRPSVFLPGQLERVTATCPDMKLADLGNSVNQTSVTHSATIAYHVKDAVLFKGSVYVGRYEHPIAGRASFCGETGRVAVLPFAALASSYMGTKYFGHWLRDDCAQYELAKALAPPLCTRRPPFPHGQDYAGLFDQNWEPTDRARIARLILFQDFAPNRFKRARQNMLRQRLWARVEVAGDSDLVYLRRGSNGAARAVENESGLIDALVARGFAVADVGTDPLARIIGALRAARLVVSLEGSHVAHCVYACRDDTGLLLLQPPDRFSLNHRNWSVPMGMTFGFVVGEGSADGYRFRVAEIFATVDKMLARLDNSRGLP